MTEAGWVLYQTILLDFNATPIKKQTHSKITLAELFLKPSNMKHKVILHIPHASVSIPFLDGYVVGKETLDQEILKLTDWYTDDLFHSETDEMIIADFSRIFCDPERFTDDSQEIMAQFGMGVLYEKSDDGEIIRKVNPQLREAILENYYWQHHQKLKNAVQEQLHQHGKALILDCHSFPSEPLKRELNQTKNRPDFNIGTDPFHTPQHLIDLSIAFFEDRDYSLGIDWPFSGSIVPLEYYQKNNHVHSIMLEINRALYLKESSNEKSESYLEIKELIKCFINTARRKMLT